MNYPVWAVLETQIDSVTQELVQDWPFIQIQWLNLIIYWIELTYPDSSEPNEFETEFQKDV